MAKHDPTAKRPPKAKDGGDLKGKPGNEKSKATRPPVDANEAIADRQSIQPERESFDPNVNQRPR